MFANGFTQGQMLNSIQGKLMDLRRALSAVQQLESWASGVAAADLEALGFNNADAEMLLSAIADAAALATIYNTGLPPLTYPQPATDYVYGASQAQVIGPQ